MGDRDDKRKQALRKSKDAKTARATGNYHEALSLVKKALGDLDVLWGERRLEIEKKPDNATVEDKDLVDALAEVHGVHGGILRSTGKHREAMAAYDKGFWFESHPARKRDNSYNLLQRLIARILVDPKQTGAPSWEVAKAVMPEKLPGALAEVRRQLRGTRDKDPWVAADAIYARVLVEGGLKSLGTGEMQRAIQSEWNQFVARDPQDFVFESNIRVTVDLLADFKKARDELESSGSRNEALETIDAAIQDLKQRFEKGLEEVRARDDDE